MGVEVFLEIPGFLGTCAGLPAYHLYYSIVAGTCRRQLRQSDEQRPAMPPVSSAALNLRRT